MIAGVPSIKGTKPRRARRFGIATLPGAHPIASCLIAACLVAACLIAACLVGSAAAQQPAATKRPTARFAGAGRARLRSQSGIRLISRAAEGQRRVALLHAADALELRAGGITSTASNLDDRSTIKGDLNSGLLAAQAHNDIDLGDLIALRWNGRFADHHVACRDIQQLVLFLDEKVVVHRVIGVEIGP